MEMTRGEIVRRWKNGAEPPKKMVKILADLNAVREQDIIRVLFEERELSGTAIYQYRKHCKLFCSDEEAKEYARKGGEDETDGTPSVSKADSSRSGSRTPSVSEADSSRSGRRTTSVSEGDSSCEGRRKAAPEVVVEMLKEWLNANFAEYNEAKRIVQQYDEMFDYWKQISGEDGDGNGK